MPPHTDLEMTVDLLALNRYGARLFILKRIFMSRLFAIAKAYKAAARVWLRLTGCR